MKKRYQIQWIMFMVLVVSMSMLQAQDSAEELSQQAANPVANLMSFPFQNNIDYGFGPYDRTRNVLNIQPVIPLAEGKLITRTIFPFIWLPDVSSESGYLFKGLSDITFTAFYVPGGGATTWGVGPVLDIPTGGSNRGSQKWNIGPSVVVLAQPEDWTLGILANNVWSFAGDSDRPDVNRGLIQYFIVRQLGDGWYVNSAPIITVNWKAADGQKWVVPFGVGAGRLIFVGKLPLNLQVGAYYNVVKPDIGPKWQFRIQAQVLLPTSILTGRK
jgi:hypothetical protein